MTMAASAREAQLREYRKPMSQTVSLIEIMHSIVFASKALSNRKEEINKLNVFPVPDGDTGTNMSLTLETVADNLAKLSTDRSVDEVRKAITTGALMGARGNSGVITSQILRGLCEGSEKHEEFTTHCLDDMFNQAVEVAFQAVRKPVEGTILTVLKDMALAAKKARKKHLSLEEALETIVAESYASVQRTPDLLPVLKQNDVVDAGAYGLAILFDAFSSALTGNEVFDTDLALAQTSAPKVEIEGINDWDGSEYRYCTEFLVYSEVLNTEEALDFLETMGDCELLVGEKPHFKVHVHTNTPDAVLAYVLERGQISEVHIHNMQLQSQERSASLEPDAPLEKKALGIVAVAPGSGNAKILESLGVDVIVPGGQTMNPSTADLLKAVSQVNAEAVIILPNNSNIIMAAQSCVSLSETPCAVVPTKTIPQAFVALFSFSDTLSLDENVELMSQALAEVKTGEVTQAIKDAKDSNGKPISAGDTIGIADGSIEAVGSSVEEVVMALLAYMGAPEADTCTILAGEDMEQGRFELLVSRIEETYGDLEIDPHRGEQPLYPIILSLE